MIENYMASYVLTDIHGCAKTLAAMINDKLQLKKADNLYLLGDYVDRGPDSKGVIDFILKLQKAGHKVRALMGNHEDMMLKARQDSASISHWYRNGGRATIESFGVNNVEDIPSRYFSFLESLEHYIDLGDYLLVHAGFNFSKPDIFEDTAAMMWTRNHRPSRAKADKRVVIHGHTPMRNLPLVKQMKSRNRLDINLDNGCVYSYPGMGQLCALNLDQWELVFQENIDL